MFDQRPSAQLNDGLLASQTPPGATGQHHPDRRRSHQRPGRGSWP